LLTALHFTIAIIAIGAERIGTMPDSMKTTDALKMIAVEARQGKWEQTVCLDAAKYIERMENDLARYRKLEAEGRMVETCTYSQEDSDGRNYNCSNCGCTWSFECDGVLENDVHYCPECGAKVTHITTRYFDYEVDDYVEQTLTREEAAAALQGEAEQK
jgi:hypothetical protein